MDAALSIKDPVAREAARQDILNTTNNTITSFEQQHQQQLDALNAAKPVAPTNPNPSGTMGKDSLGEFDPTYTTPVTYNGTTFTQGYDPMGGHSMASTYSMAREQYGRDLKDWSAKYDPINSTLDTFKLASGDVNSILSDYTNAYGKNYDAGYTGDQVAAKVAATPGYQFQMDQGTKAIERQGAAAGMVGSGNTLTALTNYGQGLAQNFYGVYMDNLSKIVAEGSGATSQIAANQAQEGKDYGTLLEAGGQAGMKTSQMIGDAQANSLYEKGKLFTQNAQFNAQMQFAGIEAGLGRQAQMAQQGVASGAGYQNAQTAANGLNYGIFQGQQGGAAYAGGAKSGWPTYTAGVNGAQGTWSV